MIVQSYPNEVALYRWKNNLRKQVCYGVGYCHNMMQICPKICPLCHVISLRLENNPCILFYHALRYEGAACIKHYFLFEREAIGAVLMSLILADQGKFLSAAICHCFLLLSCLSQLSSLNQVKMLINIYKKRRRER